LGFIPPYAQKGDDAPNDKMDEPILNYHDGVGLCTSLETTSSRLFSRGCDATADVYEDGFAFSVSVPPVGSADCARLGALIREHAGQSRSDPPSASPILVELDQATNIPALGAQKLANLAHVLVNRFLRAYEHTYFDMLVPRHRLDGRTVVIIAPEGAKRVDYAPVTLDLGDILDHYLPPHVDAEPVTLAYLMGSPDAISPSWRILVDSARHFESGNVREAVLCACSAAEIAAVPAVEEWLEQATLRRDADTVRNAVRDMGNPLRFEFCISGSCTKAFVDMSESDRVDLLTELRRMNTLRNGVVHRGAEPDAIATVAAIRAAALFVCKMWLNELERAT
jgi:hypothetical protein